MTISSHLTPQPEPRLWQLLDLARRAVERADAKIGLLTFFVALEVAFLRPLGLAASAALGAALVLGVASFFPAERSPRWLLFLARGSDKPGPDDSLTNPQELAKYTAGELILKLDRYLGGGVTGTPYYEDLVLQTVDLAVLARLKRRLLLALWGLAAAGQAAVLARLLHS